MDSRQLKYFVAVAEERNISRAAARLNLSQPPLTRHIQSLEEELGVLLFKRTTWGVELTEAGEALLIHARSSGSDSSSFRRGTIIERSFEYSMIIGRCLCSGHPECALRKR